MWTQMAHHTPFLVDLLRKADVQDGGIEDVELTVVLCVVHDHGKLSHGKTRLGDSVWGLTGGRRESVIMGCAAYIPFHGAMAPYGVGAVLWSGL